LPFSEWGSVMIAKEPEPRSRRDAKERGGGYVEGKVSLLTWQRKVGKVAEDEKDREQSTWGTKSLAQRFSPLSPSHVYCILQTSTAFLLHDRPLNITWFRLSNDHLTGPLPVP
jgi:hypothetical protein